MALDETLEVDIGDAVAVGQEKRFVSEPGPEPSHATAGVGIHARVHEVDGPRVSLGFVALHRAAAEFHGQVAVEGEVVHEEPLDILRPVAQRDHEFGESVVRVVLHDVPEDGPPADVDHRLGAGFCLLSEACTLSSGKDDHFHGDDYARSGLSEEPIGRAAVEA